MIAFNYFEVRSELYMKIVFLPKFNKDTTKVILTDKGETEVYISSNNQKTLFFNFGPIEKINRRKFILLPRQIIQLAKSKKIKKLAINFSDFVFPALKIEKKDIAEILAIGFEMANFEFVKYKNPPKGGFNFVEVIEVINIHQKEIKEGFKTGQIIGEEINNCRILANTPAGEMTPKILSEQARILAKKYGIKIKILDKKVIKNLKMGGILGVAQGSAEEPRFIILEYLKGGSQKPIVLVGKGVTFDSGGISLKPAENMGEMCMDMSGGAAVISTLVLAARLGLRKNIIGLIPAVENMPSGSSYRPGDILKTMSLKTIEVLNTDAEGRIILADALTYAKKYNPCLIIDIATLTGAAMVALGQRAIALFTKDEALEKLCREIGESSGDYVWPLPLWEEYENDIKGTFGDIINTSKTRYGGAISGAIFLYQFVKNDSRSSQKDLTETPWIHLDIAPRMTSIEDDCLAKGAVGSPVRLLIKLLQRF